MTQTGGRRGSFNGLAPILHTARLRYAAVSSAARMPASGSAMDEDDRRLDGFPASTLIRTSLDAAIEHIHALSILFIDAQVAHPHVPLTLLRASLEDASQAVWLLAPDEQDERLLRALRAWHRDFGARADFEKIEPQEAGRKTGRDRQDQMVGMAIPLRLDVHAFDSNLTATSMITEAADVVGLKREAARLWSLSSGLAHGRFWPHMKRGLDLAGATPAPGGYMLTMEASEAEVVGLARICHALIEHAERLYGLRTARP